MSSQKKDMCSVPPKSTQESRVSAPLLLLWIALAVLLAGIFIGASSRRWQRAYVPISAEPSR